MIPEAQPGPDVHASLGFYSPSLPRDQIIQAHRGEEVVITPAGTKRGDVVDVGALAASIAAATREGGGGEVYVRVGLDRGLLMKEISQATKTGHVRVSPDAVVPF